MGSGPAKPGSSTATPIYCLGCGITSTSPYEVATTVNSSLRNGEIQQGDGWFRHDGIGYRGET